MADYGGEDGNKKQNPLVKASLESPWSVANFAIIIIGGCGVWWTSQSDIGRLQDRVANQQVTIDRLERRISTNETESRATLALLQRDVTDIKVSTGAMQATLAETLRHLRNGAPR